VDGNGRWCDEADERDTSGYEACHDDKSHGTGETAAARETKRGGIIGGVQGTTEEGLLRGDPSPRKGSSGYDGTGRETTAQEHGEGRGGQERERRDWEGSPETRSAGQGSWSITDRPSGGNEPAGTEARGIDIGICRHGETQRHEANTRTERDTDKRSVSTEACLQAV
jgi:hypothetical protein